MVLGLIVFRQPTSGSRLEEHDLEQDEQKYFGFVVDSKRDLLARGLDFAHDLLLLAEGYGSTIYQDKAAA